MEHTVYLAAKAFVEEIGPKKPKSFVSTKNGTVTVEEDDEDDEEVPEEEDGLDWTADWTYLDSISDDEEVDKVFSYLPGDVLGKVLALVNQVFLLFFFFFFTTDI